MRLLSWSIARDEHESVETGVPRPSMLLEKHHGCKGGLRESFRMLSAKRPAFTLSDLGLRTHFNSQVRLLLKPRLLSWCMGHLGSEAKSLCLAGGDTVQQHPLLIAPRSEGSLSKGLMPRLKLSVYCREHPS